MLAKVFLYLWLGFLCGVALESIDLNSFVLPLTLFLFAAAIVSLSLGYSRVVAVACICLGLLFGSYYSQTSSVNNEYISVVGQEIEWHGSIARTPEIANRNQQLVIKPDNFSQYLQVYLFFPIDVKIGDRVLVRGFVELPKSFADFDYVKYLENRNIYVQLKTPRVLIIQRVKPSLNSKLADLKYLIVKKSEHLYSGDSGSLILGMLIGYRQNLSDEFQLALRKTSTTHIVAVSGFNMTIVATSFGIFAWYIGRRTSLLITVIAVICFAILTGGQAAVIRAAIMALLLVYAQLSGRLYNSLYSLVWTIGLMTAHNPKILTHDIGFQLSITATFGLLAVYQFKPDESTGLGLKDIIRSTLAATIFTAPLIAYYFGTLSVVSLPVNILVLPLVPWIMLLGFFSFLPIVGQGFVLLADGLASIVIRVIVYFSELSFSSAELVIGKQETFFLYLLILIIVARKFYSRQFRD